MANYKMVNGDQLDADLAAVADAIRAKTGGADAIAFPNGFVAALAAIGVIPAGITAIDVIEYTVGGSSGSGNLDLPHNLGVPPNFVCGFRTNGEAAAGCFNWFAAVPQIGSDYYYCGEGYGIGSSVKYALLSKSLFTETMFRANHGSMLALHTTFVWCVGVIELD